jgi:biofilm PGA synthesis N-glycosyltransferase PgaC
MQDLASMTNRVSHQNNSTVTVRQFDSTEVAPRILSYVLITPARNEAQFIELTIKSVVGQTVRPLKWVIVSDGSTDSTDEIVAKYLPDHPWIEMARMPERRERHFAGKVQAFNAGRAKAAGLSFDIIGNLDADVTFDQDYFEFLMTRFAEDPELGVAGTAFTENALEYDYRFTNIEHVSGQVQLFRKQCFEDIGGYLPRRLGGIDWVAVTTARMKGWRTRTFPEKIFVHHRPMSSAMHSGLAVPFKGGRKDYVLGNHPVWEFFRCIYQATRPPVLIGGGFRFAGFVWAMVGRSEQVPIELVRFTRQEQLRRLWRLFAPLEKDGTRA